MIDCPYDDCDYESDSEYGVKIHHKKTHGISLRGKLFECENCGEEKRRKKYRLDKHEKNFCSDNCRLEFEKDAREGEVIECHVCGQEKYLPPAQFSDTSSGKHFCSRKCKGKHYSGQNNPNWKQGNNSDFTKTPEGREWRNAVLERDNYTCQECGTVPEVPHAHHIKCKEDYPELKTDVDNGKTLCEYCHYEKHEDEPWSSVILHTSDYTKV